MTVPNKNQRNLGRSRKISFTHNLSTLSVCRPRWISKGIGLVFCKDPI